MSHLTIRSEKNQEILEWYRHEILYWKYISSVSPFMNYLGCWICSSYILHEKLNRILLKPDWPFVSFWNLKPLYFIFSYSFSIVVPIPVIGCHSLSLVITRCHSLLLVVIRFHSIYHWLSFVVTRCHSLHLSLSFAVPLVAIRCHLLYHSLPLVFTRCINRLSFYKRS